MLHLELRGQARDHPIENPTLTKSVRRVRGITTIRSSGTLPARPLSVERPRRRHALNSHTPRPARVPLTASGFSVEAVCGRRDRQGYEQKLQARHVGPSSATSRGVEPFDGGASGVRPGVGSEPARVSLVVDRQSAQQQRRVARSATQADPWDSNRDVICASNGRTWIEAGGNRLSALVSGLAPGGVGRPE